MYISLNENKNQYYGQCCCFLELKMYISVVIRKIYQVLHYYPYFAAYKIIHTKLPNRSVLYFVT